MVGWCCYCYSPAADGSGNWHDACRQEAVHRRESGRCIACGRSEASHHGTCKSCVGVWRYRGYPGNS